VQSTIPEPDDEDEELQEVLELLRCEAEFQRRVGQHYKHGGESGGGGVKGLFRRGTSQRERPRDFNVIRAKAPIQTRIDTSLWTSKGKNAKKVIGQAWSKWFHISGIPGRNEFTIFIVTNMSLICTTSALNSRGHYVSGMDTGQLNALRTAFERMTDLDTAAAALSEAQTFCAKVGSFSSPLAHKMTVDGKTSPGMQFSTLFYCNRCINLETDVVFISFLAAWWQMSGYSTPAL
jgi:hypothetical protein